MNIALWASAFALAVVFTATGTMKTIRYEQDRDKLDSIKDLPRPLVTFIGICEILAALGLILPAATGIMPWLTPLAAIGLVLVMVFATSHHLARHETSGIALTLVLLVLATFVAYGRLFLAPLA